MKYSVKTRLQRLEKALNVTERHKCALVVCNPDIADTFDFPRFDADHVLILPDNGRRLPGEPIPIGSYSIRYY